MMAILSASAVLVTLSALGALGISAVAAYVLLAFAVFTAGMTAFWLTSWPTRRQSALAMIAGMLFISGWSFVQENAALAVLACTATAVTGGYIAFFHNVRLLLLNLGVAVVTAMSACWRLAGETSAATAFAAFWIILFLNVSVPLAIAGAARAMSTYVMRSDVDPLTGLLNRRGFTDVMKSRLENGASTDSDLVVAMLDLDAFKAINDTEGHAAGDRALRAVANLLRQKSPPDSAICRAGGEEFLIAAIGTVEPIEDTVQRMCTDIAELPHRVTASVGVSSTALDHLPNGESGPLIDQLIETADTAMYTAKRSGGNRVHRG